MPFNIAGITNGNLNDSTGTTKKERGAHKGGGEGYFY